MKGVTRVASVRGYSVVRAIFPDLRKANLGLLFLRDSNVWNTTFPWTPAVALSAKSSAFLGRIVRIAHKKDESFNKILFPLFP